MAYPRQPLRILSLSGASLRAYLPALAALRIEVFRDWPYLYEGDTAFEECYLQTYVDSPGAIVVLALDGDDAVGAATGLPLADETPEFKRPFVEHGYDPASVFYCAESVLLRPYRGRGVGGRFFDERERHARALGGFRYSSFCRVERPDDHPLRPASYVPLDNFWQRRGYVEHPELRTLYGWKDVGATVSTDKSMVFWLKSLHTGQEPPQGQTHG